MWTLLLEQAAGNRAVQQTARHLCLTDVEQTKLAAPQDPVSQ